MEPLIRSGQARKLSFTGSTQVGQMLLEQCAEKVLRTSMELGGNAPFIVFEDADLDEAVAGAMAAKMRNMGEACTAANRIYRPRVLIDEFGAPAGGEDGRARRRPWYRGRGQRRTADRRGGTGEGAELVADAVARGATVLTGGERPTGPATSTRRRC